MRFEQVKKPSQMNLAGITIDADETDKALSRVRLTDAYGNFVEFRKNWCGSLEAFVEAPPKTEKRWMLSGIFAGLAAVEETFESDHEADERRREYRRAYSGPEENFGLTVVETEIEVE